MNFKKYSDKTIELIKGGYDLHVHTSPSHFNRSVDDFEVAREADKFEMAGILIKSHYETTAARAYIVNKYGDTNTNLYGSAVLNWPLGGINPYAVESSLKMGAKIIFMPTRDSQNSLKHGNMPGDFFERKGITIYDENLKIKESIYETLEIVRKYNAAIATGHLSIKESIDICNEARKMKVKTLLTHPDWERTIVPLDIQLDLVKKGVIVEKVWANIVEETVSPQEIIASLNELGSENIYMVTDRGQAELEKPVEAMLSFIEFLLANGVSEKDIINMTRNVPESILNQ
jgi:hypothetical protein